MREYREIMFYLGWGADDDDADRYADGSTKGSSGGCRRPGIGGSRVHIIVTYALGGVALDRDRTTIEFCLDDQQLAKHNSRCGHDHGFTSDPGVLRAAMRRISSRDLRFPIRGGVGKRGGDLAVQ